MKLDTTVIAQLNVPINNVWGHIADDAYEAGGRVSNTEAMEMVLDANRMSTFGHKDAETLVDELCKEHGYVKVNKFLCKHFKLVR
jgi:hypothetical protein